MKGTTGHPTVEQLGALVRGTLERQQAKGVVAHLLFGCKDCGSLVASLIQPGFSVPDRAYDLAFERASQALGEGRLLPFTRPARVSQWVSC